MSCDIEFAQSIAEEIFEEYGLEEGSYIIKAVKERVQRWLVNGRNSKHTLDGHNLELPDCPNSFWVEWAKRYQRSTSAGWMKVTLQEIMTNFLSDEIIIGLQFEAELVDYFEVTYK